MRNRRGRQRIFCTASGWHQEGCSSNTKVVWFTSCTCPRAISHPFNATSHLKVDHNNLPTFTVDHNHFTFTVYFYVSVIKVGPRKLFFFLNYQISQITQIPLANSLERKHVFLRIIPFGSQFLKIFSPFIHKQI